MGNYAAAIADFTCAIEFDPDDANTYYNRALSYDLLGNFATALPDYQQFLVLYTEEDDSTDHARSRITALGG